MRKLVNNILRIVLLLFCLLPFNLQVKAANQTERHFQEQKLEEYRQDNDFQYGMNPYRKNTISNRIRYYFIEFLRMVFSNRGATPYIRLLILLAILVFAVIKLSGGQFEWIFGKGRKNQQGHVFLPEEEIDVADLNALAAQALQAGDLRLCVRYHYLYILKELDKKSFINYHKDKTNRDYLREIHSPDIRSQFQQQTLVFDYVWYGKFPLNHDQFHNVQSGFQRLAESIHLAKQGSDHES